MNSSSELPFDNSPYIIPINKPAGISSYDVIRDLKPHIFDLLGKGKGRRKLKIGHFGTLDPFADGLLMVATGKALKLMQYFQSQMPKTYRGLGTFEFSTNTGDCDGDKVEPSLQVPSTKPSLDSIDEACKGFLGRYSQVPPYFSAVKHEGKPLYEWARDGVFIDKPAVERLIYSYKIIEQVSENDFVFEATVSSGTYIRGLWFDLAKNLGLPGHLKKLTRTSWGDFPLNNSIDLPLGPLDKFQLINPAKLWNIPRFSLNSLQSEYFTSGRFLRLSDIGLSGQLEEFQWIFDENDRLLGLGVPIRKNNQDFLKVEVSLT